MNDEEKRGKGRSNLEFAPFAAEHRGARAKVNLSQRTKLIQLLTFSTEFVVVVS